MNKKIKTQKYILFYANRRKQKEKELLAIAENKKKKSYFDPYKKTFSP
jgi:hypothetical protein